MISLKDAIYELNHNIEFKNARMVTEGEVAIYLEELQRYIDLEKQGRLIELPCAVGDTVYDIADRKIRKQIVDGIEYMADGFFIYANEDVWLGRLGNLVFLTKAEAEAALKESEKE